MKHAFNTRVFTSLIEEGLCIYYVQYFTAKTFALNSSTKACSCQRFLF